jgi:hypothetical protein
MAWIESHQALGRHPKTIRLAALLKVRVPEAVGLLQFLWWWALDYAPDGLVSVADQPVVARACLWHGPPARFWEALLEVGFVEPAELPHVCKIHDWMDYAGRLVERRKADKERKRVQRTSAGHPEQAGVDVRRTVHNSTGAATRPHPTPTPPLTNGGPIEAAPRAASTTTIGDALNTLYGPPPTPERLPNGAQQCPLCPDVFTGSYAEHLDSPRHKIHDEPADLSDFHA